MVVSLNEQNKNFKRERAWRKNGRRKAGMFCKLANNESAYNKQEGKFFKDNGNARGSLRRKACRRQVIKNETNENKNK